MLLTLAACASPTTDAILSVAIDGGDRSVVRGTTLSLTASVEASGGADDTVAWSSSDEAVATVDATGTLTAHDVGSTVVTATATADPHASDSIDVTVVQQGSVLSVAILGGDRTLAPGAIVKLEADVQVDGEVDDALTWTSTFTDAATIDQAGRLSAHASGTTTIVATSVADPTMSDSILVTVEPLGALRWTRQFGTVSDDLGYGIATDELGNVDVVGMTRGALDGGDTAIGSDAYVRSYDRDGNLRWTRQFGTSGAWHARAVATDADGHVYVAGYRGRSVSTEPYNWDAFVRSYDRDGNDRWHRGIRTGGTDDFATAIAVDGEGNVIVAGSTEGALTGGNAGSSDAFVRSFDGDGSLRWTRQFGTSSEDVATALAVDGEGTVYVAGHTHGALDGAHGGSSDVFVRSIDGGGSPRWTRQFGGSAADEGHGVATDAAGNVYVVGFTGGALFDDNIGRDDAFVRSYDALGNVRWSRQFGTSTRDRSVDVTVDATGDVFVVGSTRGDIEAPDSSGAFEDAFIRSYDSVGGLHWTRQFGTRDVDIATAVAVDSFGGVLVTGFTFGHLEGTNAGSVDAFVRVYGR